MQIELTKKNKRHLFFYSSVSKRFFDITFSLFVLVLCTPIFLIISLLNSILSPGPIFYSHERIGKNRKKIRCLKFRTMHIGADKILDNLLKTDPLLKKEWDMYYKLKKDPRITPIGQFLRKNSLDELPQFFNVLKGDLSIVGPRPCVDLEVKQKFKDKADKILSMRPGITGIWQTSGRNNIDWDERLKLDEEYIDNHSFIMDLCLIFKTIGVMFSSKGAY